jgi:hypothetical protein
VTLARIGSVLLAGKSVRKTVNVSRVRLPQRVVVEVVADASRRRKSLRHLRATGRTPILVANGGAVMVGRSMMGAVALFFGAGAALAQGLEAENLLVAMPDGFEVGYQAAQDDQEIHELIPSGESVEDWSQMVTIQIFRGLSEVPGDLFAANMAGNWEGACEGATVNKLTEGEVNGFPFVMWFFGCPLNAQTGKPETMYFKGISGSDAFYSVQYAFRSAPADELDTIALTYLVGASACDTRRPERPCPAGM